MVNIGTVLLGKDSRSTIRDGTPQTLAFTNLYFSKVNLEWNNNLIILKKFSRFYRLKVYSLQLVFDCKLQRISSF